ncbi:hypothetical protein NGM33_28720 [Nocardiopsis dassonvillei]|uniref:hypothetical protein n=1 Tax=Nocardiopsis dassonvillei TaxID=2014 RepID=UPI0020A23B69|nr:hypothetical protein [Nocardiopsis dassonvillei]MCP3017321.1 hypothetical protein [Nocardiopsis dassonvillei]
MTKTQQPRLTPTMRTKLTEAAARWDRSLWNTNRRTVLALEALGLVDVKRGVTTSYFSPKKGYWVTKHGITDVKINAAGRAAINA